MDENEKIELFINILEFFEKNQRSKIEGVKLPVFSSNSKEIRWISPYEKEVYFTVSSVEYNIEIILRFSKDVFFVSSEFLDKLMGEIKNNNKKITAKTLNNFLLKHGVKSKIGINEKCTHNFPKHVSSNDRVSIKDSKTELKKYLDINNIKIDENFFNEGFSPFRGSSGGDYSKNLVITLYQRGYVFAVIDRKFKYQEEIQNEIKKLDVEYISDFFKMINKNWNYYNMYIKNILVYGVRAGQQYESDYREIGFSLFGIMLREYPWLLDQIETPRTAREIFIKNKITEDLGKIYLLSTEIENKINKNIIEFLDLNRSPDITLLLEKITSFKTKEISDAKEAMHEINEKFWNLYKEIKNEQNKETIRDYLKNNQIPVINGNKLEFVDIDKIVWTSQITKKYSQQTIDKIYFLLTESGYEVYLKKFFTDIMEIKQEYTPQQLISYYKDLTNKILISDEEKDFILHLYEEAGKYDILSYLIDSCDLLNLNNKFSSNIKYISFSPDINKNLLSNFKERTIGVSKKMYKSSQDRIKSTDSLYSKWEQMNWKLLSPPFINEEITIEGGAEL